MSSRNCYALLLGLVLMPSTTYASLYSITYYELIGLDESTLSDYQVSGSGTFEINNQAVNPNNLVLYENPDFVSFEVNFTTTMGNATFSLTSSDFPTGDQFAGPDQGILFDNSAVPLRFDTPSTSEGNTAIICEPTCNALRIYRDAFWMWDNDGFERVLLDDGTIINLSDLPQGTNYTRLGGDWNFSPLGSISDVGGFYLISIAAASLRCDLNNNGDVDAGDLSQVVRMALGSIADDLDCDINNSGSGDGVISIADLVIVSRIVLGIIPEIYN